MSMHEEDWFGDGMQSIPELEWQYQQIVDPGCEDDEIEPIEDWANLGEF